MNNTLKNTQHLNINELLDELEKGVAEMRDEIMVHGNERDVAMSVKYYVSLIQEIRAGVDRFSKL